MIFCQLCPTQAESGDRSKDGLERCPTCGTTAILSDVDFPTLAAEIREWDAHVARLKLACDDGELGDRLEDVVFGAIYGAALSVYGEPLTGTATVRERIDAFFGAHREPLSAVAGLRCVRCGQYAPDWSIEQPIICAPVPYWEVVPF